MLRSPSLFALSVFLLVACDGDGDADAGAPDSGAMDAGGADAGEPGCDAGADPFSCEDLTPDPACPASWVVGLTGTVVDAAGAPVENARTQACLRLHPDDSLVCLGPPSTDAEGRFAIVIPEQLRCLNRAVMRVLAPLQPYGPTYCPIDFPAGVQPIHAIPDAYVLRSVSAATVPDRGDGTAERDITFPDGVVVTVAPDALAMSADYDELSGGAVPASATECFAGGLLLDGAYVFSPESLITGGAAVRIPNTDGLAPTAEVDLYIVGGLETFLLDGTTVEEAELANIGTGVVSTDGMFIDSAMDSRLPYLSWLAWKAR